MEVLSCFPLTFLELETAGNDVFHNLENDRLQNPLELQFNRILDMALKLHGHLHAVHPVDTNMYLKIIAPICIVCFSACGRLCACI